MSNSRDETSQEPSTEGPSATAAPGNDKRSGRIAYDERGNSVWEWQIDTGVYSRDINTQRLQKLDLNELSIAETAKHRCPPGLDDPSAGHTLSGAMPGGGFNPYDNSSTVRGNVGGHPYNSAGRPALKPEPKVPPQPRQPMDQHKVQEWLEIRKRLQEKKQDDDD